MNMTIRIKCPNPACGREFVLKPELVGRSLRCAACQQKFTVSEAGVATLVPPSASQAAPVAPVFDPEAQTRREAPPVPAPEPAPPPPPPPEPPDPLIGQKLGHYRVVEKVGTGGMATVYKGRDLRLDKTVALKVMAQAVMARGREFAERFIREARTAAKVEHINVLPVHFIGVEDDHLFIAMQFVDGGTLDDRLRQSGRLPQQEAARIMRDVALALEAAHAHSIVHRDIKPSNILLTRDGRVLVSDFGVAKIGEDAADLTSAGEVMGTPAFMAPEHCQGLKVDGRSDLYSLGIMFYRTLIGQLPILGKTPLETVRLQLSAAVPDPRTILPELDGRLASIIMRLTAKAPEERYQTAAEVAAHLTSVLGPPSAAGATAGGTVQVPVLPQPLAPAQPVTEAPPSRKTAWVVLGVLGALLILGAAGEFAYFAYHQWQAGMKAGKSAGENHGAGMTSPAPTPLPSAAEQKPSQAAPQKPSAQPPPAAAAKPPESAPGTAPKPATAGPAPGAAAAPKEQKAPPAALPPAASLPMPAPASPPSAAPPAQAAASALDLSAYVEDIAPVNEHIVAGNYLDARSRANLLKEKYPALIEVKLANIDRIIALRKRCFARVNSGEVKVAMGEVSKRFAFAGDIKRADETGLTAAMTFKKGWDRLTKEEQANFCRKASDPDNADDMLGIAAVLMEGSATEKEYDQAMDVLGAAAGLKADVAPLEKYLKTLKQAAKEARTGRAPAATEPAEGDQSRDRKGAEKAEAAAPAPEAQPGGGAGEKKTEGGKSYDEIYVTVAATDEKIPHPLSKKTKASTVAGKSFNVPEGMVAVPVGPFIMGDDANPLASPPHRADVEAFFIDKYEVTNAQYMEFVKVTPRPMPDYIMANGGEVPKGRENHPVTHVSWEDAKAYCEWCGKRLPTEAEWEKAASWNALSRRKLKYPWGDGEDDDLRQPLANWALRWGWKPRTDAKMWRETFEVSDKGKEVTAVGGATTPVGSFRKGASPWGCYDMSGNVEEWVEDWFDKYPGNTTLTGKREVLLGEKFKVLRGGDWSATRCTPCTLRGHAPPKSRILNSGFRCAKSP